METNNLPGSLKVAVLLRSVEKETQEKLLSMLTQREKESIVKNLSQLNDISPNVIENVSEEFTQRFNQKDYKRKGKSLDSVNVTLSKRNGKLEAIQSIEPDKLFKLIKNEHPQTMAVIVAHLKPETASIVLSMLPDEVKSDVAVRIVNLDKVISGMVDEIDNVFEDILSSIENEDTYKTGGIDNLAEILNQSDEDTIEKILNAVEEVDEDLVAKIKQRMFIFDDLILVEDRGMQQVLRKVDTKELAVALKATTDEVKKKVFKNMSERAGKILTEEIEMLRAIKIKDVEEAQRKITDIVQKMESNGELAIIRSGGGDYI